MTGSPRRSKTDSNRVAIRAATSADIPAIAALIPRSVRELSAGHYSPEQIDLSLLEVFCVDSRLIEDGTYFVAEIAGRIVGAGGWSCRQALFGGDLSRGALPGGLLDPAASPARIRAFYVHPSFARRGIGRRLLERCEAEASSAGFSSFELAATLPGVPLYESAGYRAIERFEISLSSGPGLTAVRMGKSRLASPE